MNNELIERIDREREHLIEMLRITVEGTTLESELIRSLKLAEDCKASLTQQQQEAEPVDARIQKAERNRGELIKELESLATENARLRASRFVRFDNDECWIYQGDGSDRLESLVCPVVISAPELMEILDRPPKPAAQPQVPMQVTDGGRNELYEGLFDDETALEREERLRKARVPQQVPEGWDSEAYMSVCDGLEYWKKRAEEAEQALERTREDLSPTHMGEPVLPQWSGWACQYPGKMPRLYGAREIAEANCYRENGDTLIYLQSSAAQHVEYKGWYCAHCQRGVDSSEVTYNEQHQSCGRVITDDKPPAAQPLPMPDADGNGCVHTGNAEADAIINRLNSDDPTFEALDDAVAFIYKLVSEHKGPEGFATWKDAAIAERLKNATQPQVPEGIVEKYNELLYHVARAFPNESRHETALRYIKNAESVESYCAAAKEEGK